MKQSPSLGVLAAFGAASGIAAIGVSRAHFTAQQQTKGGGGDPSALVMQVIGQRCFAPGTPPEVIAELGENIYGLGLRFQVGGRWPGTAGQGISLTYSFPPDSVSIPGGSVAGEATSNNSLNATLDAQFASQGGTAQWKALFRQCFDEWTAVTGNTYTEVADDGAAWGANGSAGVRGDIRIGMHVIDGGNGILAYNFFPSGGADMVLDASENWGNSFGSWRFLRNVATHEHGHGLGFFHVCPITQGKLLEPFYSPNFDGPQQDDIRGAQGLYGDHFEPNGTTFTATNLDAAPFNMAVNTPINISNLSIGSFGDADVFKFVAPVGSTISASLVPVGTTYLNGPQNGDGSCSAGTAVNALTQQDLGIEILNAGGGVIATQNLNGPGVSEQLTDFNLGSAGTYFVRIRSFASSGDVQLYTASFTRKDIGIVGDLSHDGCVSATDLGILLGSWGPGPSSADLNNDGFVNSQDLALLLGAWGSGAC